MSKNGILEKFWIWELTIPAFEEWLQEESAPVIIVGIGSIEQYDKLACYVLISYIKLRQ